MGNSHSNSPEVVYCGIFAQFQMRNNIHYSEMVADESGKKSSEDWKQTEMASSEICSFAKVDVNTLTTERYVSVTVVPYFGKLAGREVYFHVFKDNDTIEINLGLHNSIYGPLLCDKDFKLR